MNGHALVEGLQSASAGIAVGKAFAHRTEDKVVLPDRPADDQRTGVFQCLPNPLATRDLADAGMAGIIAKNHHIPREKRRVRPRKIEQHVVVARHRDNEHFGDLR